jgi:hypothetical protein
VHRSMMSAHQTTRRIMGDRLHSIRNARTHIVYLGTTHPGAGSTKSRNSPQAYCSTLGLALLPISTLNPRRFSHVRWSNLIMLQDIVLTDLPSKCSQSNGGGLLGLVKGGRPPVSESRGDDPAAKLSRGLVAFGDRGE